MLSKMLVRKIVFDFGDKVAYNTKKSGDEGIVCEILLSPGQVQYSITWSDKSTSKHFDFELKKITQ